MDPKAHVRRDILWGCARCPDVGFRQARQTLNSGKSSLQYHINTQHPDVTNWEDLKIHGGFRVKHQDGSTSRISYEGNEHLVTKHADRNQGRSSRSGRASTKTPPTTRRATSGAPQPVSSSTASTLSADGPLVKAGSEIDTVVTFTDTTEGSPGVQESPQPGATFSSPSEESRSSTEVLMAALTSYESQRNVFETNMARIAGSARDFVPRPPTHSKVSTAPILIYPGVQLSRFDQEVMQGRHGKELQSLCRAALMGDGTRQESRDKQWYHLAMYLAERGNFALGEHGQGLMLPTDVAIR